MAMSMENDKVFMQALGHKKQPKSGVFDDKRTPVDTDGGCKNQHYRML